MPLQVQNCTHTERVQIQISNTWMSTKLPTGESRAQHAHPIVGTHGHVRGKHHILQVLAWYELSQY